MFGTNHVPHPVAARAERAIRRQSAPRTYAKPELLAPRPNELWSWDITKLKGPVKWTYYYLYKILDVYSRPDSETHGQQTASEMAQVIQDILEKDIDDFDRQYLGFTSGETQQEFAKSI